MRLEMAARKRASWQRAWLLVLWLACAFEPLLAQSPEAPVGPDQIEEGEFDPAADAALAQVVPGPPARKTITPWIVQVLGENFEKFTNEDASKVISDWLMNSLIDLDLFEVVNREQIRDVLSEKNLALSGFSRDTSNYQLASAAKFLSVNYILLGNVKNLGANSEVDFKLLDVDTTTYSPAFHANFEVPFNPVIGKFKTVVDRVVAELAVSFPIAAEIWERRSDTQLVLAAGSDHGLADGAAAKLWSKSTGRAVATGVITAVGPAHATVTLDRPAPIGALSGFEARITIAPGPEAVLAKAKLAIKAKEFADARKTLAQGLEKYPQHGRLLRLHAQSCWRFQDYEGAVGSYREALKAEPNDPELLEEAAQVLFEAGHFQEVVENLSSEGRSTDTLDLELQRGKALAIQGYPRQAREAFKRAFRIDPTDPKPHLRLAALAARAGDRSEVERELRLARESGSKTLEIALADAIFSGLSSNPPNLAETQPLVELAVGEGDFAALALASEILMLAPGLSSSALELAEKSVEINPAFLQGTILTAEAQALAGTPERALKTLEQALSLHPNNVALLLRAGELFSDAGDFANAKARLQQAQDLAPLQWRAAESLGDSRVRQNEHLQAVDAYQDALKIAEKAGERELTVILRKLGRSAVLGDQHGAGQPYLERCVAGAPDDKECRYYLGLCYYRANLSEADEKAISNLQAANSFNVDAYHYLGALYDRREAFLAAADWYQKCVDEGCSLATESQARLDDIESIRGTVIARPRNQKQVSIDLGRIHGVLPSQIALVVSQGEIIGRILTEQVQEKTSEAKIKGGEPLSGHTVIFRPTRPRNLEVQPSSKRGVSLTWNISRQPGLASFVIYRKEKKDPSWEVRKVVSEEESRFDDGSVKPGKSYSYQVVATNKVKQESLPSRVVDITIEERKKD